MLSSSLIFEQDEERNAAQDFMETNSFGRRQAVRDTMYWSVQQMYTYRCCYVCQLVVE